MPWRTPPGEIADGVRPDPFRVWLSEIMLQQTTVSAVNKYFTKFTRLWPSVEKLAAASEADVLKAWAGLGYYSRARNLKRCADLIAADHGGRFPNTAQELAKLPGIGAYTSAAIAAIAFGEAVPVVDGNVERVITRLHALSTPLPSAKPEIRQLTAAMLDHDRPGDFAQAMMDLGATICTPKKPACLHCPLNISCQALANGDPEHFPVKAPKRARPTRQGAAFVLTNGDGAILVEQRGDKGLLAGMTQVPTSAWNARQDGSTDLSAAPSQAAAWVHCGSIEHVFTHFELRLQVYRAHGDVQLASGQWWSPPETIAGEALPTVMKKVLARALQHESDHDL